MISASRAIRVGLAAVALAAATSSCGGGTPAPLSEEGDLPPKPTAAPTAVDVCSLLTPADLSVVFDGELSVVGVEYGASRVPTLRCLLGVEFGVAVVRTELAVGPIAENVFTEAYGDPAGGDPELVRRFGLADADIGPGPVFGYLRNEKDDLSIHVYDAGSIVSLQIASDPARPVKRAEVVSLAATMITRLPENPELKPTDGGASCSRVSSDAVGAAVGAAPTAVAEQSGPAGAVMCSWAAFPGSATVTVVRDPASIAAYRRNLDENLYSPVEAIAGSEGLEVISREDHAGDLTIFNGRRAMAVVTVIPSAGFADGSVATTPGEQDLAASVIETLVKD